MLAESLPFNKLHTSRWPKSYYVAIPRGKEVWGVGHFKVDTFDS